MSTDSANLEIEVGSAEWFQQKTEEIVIKHFVTKTHIGGKFTLGSNDKQGITMVCALHILCSIHGDIYSYQEKDRALWQTLESFGKIDIKFKPEGILILEGPHERVLKFDFVQPKRNLPLLTLVRNLAVRQIFMKNDTRENHFTHVHSSTIEVVSSADDCQQFLEATGSNFDF